MSDSLNFDEFYDLAESQDEEASYFEPNHHGEERYQIQKFLAEGGMKVITKVFDQATQRPLAMAQLKDEAPKELHDLFFREAKLTAQLEHPNIIKVHDVGRLDNGQPFFTMELKTGQTYEQHLEQRDQPPTKPSQIIRALDPFMKICDAISYAHSKNIVHLDLKPENIQIGHHGEIVICDWGLAKVVGTSEESHQTDLELDLLHPDLINGLTINGNVKGTPGYMSPEQAAGATHKSFPSDIYSLACILFKILTQTLPVHGSPEDMVEQTKSGQISSLADHKHVPFGLVSIVDKATALHEQDRYQSIDDFIEDLRRYRDGYAPLAENASFSKEIRLVIHRNMGVSISIALAILSFVMLSTWFIANLKEKNRVIAQALKRAEQESENVKKALEIVKEEQSLTTSIFKNNSEEIMQEIYHVSDVNLFVEPLQAIKKAEKLLLRLLREQPDHKSAKEQLGYLYFLKQEFSSALKYLDPSSESTSDLIWLSKRFNTRHSGVLEVEQLKNLHRELLHSKKKWRKITALLILYLDAPLRLNAKEHLDIIESFIRSRNHRWKGDFLYRENEKSLILNGKGLLKIAFLPNNLIMKSGPHHQSASFLKNLNLKTLALENTDIFELSQIETLSTLEHLILKKSLVTDLSPLQNLPNLKKLSIDKDQFSQQQLNKLKTDLMITFNPPR